MGSANWGSGACLRWDVWMQERDGKGQNTSNSWIMWASVLLLGPGVWRRCPLSQTVKSTGFCFHCVQNQNPILFSLFFSVAYWAQWQVTNQRKNLNKWVEKLTVNRCFQTGVLPDRIKQHAGMYTNAEQTQLTLILNQYGCDFERGFIVGARASFTKTARLAVFH